MNTFDKLTTWGSLQCCKLHNPWSFDLSIVRSKPLFCKGSFAEPNLGVGWDHRSLNMIERRHVKFKMYPATVA